MSRRPSQESAGALSIVCQALAAAAGPALVLDPELRVVLATPEAERMLEASVPLGAAAAKVLCRNSPKRELAQALVEGMEIEAVIPHPGPRVQGAQARSLKVRSILLGKKRTPSGFLLLLDEGYALGAAPVQFQGMWTQSPAMREVFRVIERVAPADVTVLVRGETGTGKELVAHALHALSARTRGPFQAINCAALPPTLLESALFGHMRGAFTGAVRDTQGHFQLAHRGTLFLDEIGELSLELQAKLLRVLETHTVLPVGAQKPVPVDVRIVSATHRALRKEVEAGRFRADLMYRLRVVPIFLPALRARKGDVELLCSQFIAQLNQQAQRRIERVAPEAMHALERYDWPGNVRELSNVLAYAYTMGDGPLLTLRDLPPELRDAVDEVGSGEAKPVSDEARALLDVLRRAGGNKQRAAKMLGISRVTLWRRLRELQLMDAAARA